jgi:hypothetical protein
MDLGDSNITLERRLTAMSSAAGAYPISCSPKHPYHTTWPAISAESPVRCSEWLGILQLLSYFEGL